MGEYTHPPLEGNYTVSYNEDQGGMEVIYDITNIFLDAVIKPNLFPDNFLKDNFPDLDSITNAGGEVFVENIQEIIVQNIPLLICIILGPLMALATLLCGLCFCCCCGNKKNKGGGKEGGFKTVMLTIVLVLLLVITSVGCMWFFLGAQRAKGGLDEIPEEFEAILHDGELFINHTIEELEYLLVENLDETLKNFNDTLTQIESEFDELKNSLIQEISPLNDTAHEFLDLVRQFNQAAVNISEMNNIKEGLTTDIDTVLSQLSGGTVCDIIGGSEVCANLIDVLSNTKSQIESVDFDMTQVSTAELDRLTDIFADVTSALNEADITSVFDDIIGQIDEVKNMLSDEADNLIGPIQENIGDIFTQTGGIVDDMKSVRDDFFPYFKTATLVLGSFFVVVLVVFFLGALCGSCSKRGGQSASGAATLLFSTNIVLILLAVLLFLLTTAMFIFGALSQKLLCKTLHDPANSELLTFASPLISEELRQVYGNDSVTIDVAEIIQGIHNGTALYPLLQLNYIYDITSLENWESEFGVDVAIDDGRQMILKVMYNFATYGEKFNSTREGIKGLGAPVDTAIAAIKDLISKVDFNIIKDCISQLTDIRDTPNVPDDFKTELTKLIDSLETVDKTLANTIAFFNNAILDQFLQQDTITMEEKIDDTLGTIDDAFNLVMNPTSPYYIPTFFENSIIAPILKIVNDYINFAITEATTNIGETSPLSNIYNATYTDICQEIVNPFNAVWSGLGWCLLLLLLPVTLVINSLRKLYCTSKRSPALRQYQSTDKGRPTMDRVVSYTEVSSL